MPEAERTHPSRGKKGWITTNTMNERHLFAAIFYATSVISLSLFVVEYLATRIKEVIREIRK
jgi:hypothetical protein